jgi:hypothetical protein
MFFTHELYILEYYKKIIEKIAETIEIDKIEDIDLINCLNDMTDKKTTDYFLNGVSGVINKIHAKYKITEDILDCIFDIYFKYMFDIDLVLVKSKSMSYKQYLILEECKWVLKSSDATHWHGSPKKSFDN